jgi:hypothetical protein
MNITRNPSITTERAKRQKAEKRVAELEAAARKVISAKVQSADAFYGALDELKAILDKTKKPAPR